MTTSTIIVLFLCCVVCPMGMFVMMNSKKKDSENKDAENKDSDTKNEE